MKARFVRPVGWVAAALRHCPAVVAAAALFVLAWMINNEARDLRFGKTFHPGVAYAQATEGVAHQQYLGLVANPVNQVPGSAFYRSDLDTLRFRVGALETWDGTNFVKVGLPGIVVAGTGAGAIQAAIDAVPSTGGTVYVPAGTYTECGITLKSNLVLFGAGWGAITAGQNNGGTVIQCSTGDIFDIAGTLENVIVTDLAAVSNAGGGHIFNFNNQLVSKVELVGLRLEQKNTGKSIVSATGTAGHGFFGNWIHKGDFAYQDGNTVPAINISTETVNQVVLEDFRITQLTKLLASTYAIHIESVNAGGAALACTVRQITGEQNRGGLVRFVSVSFSSIEGVGEYDLAQVPDNPLIHITKGASAPKSENNRLVNLFMTNGNITTPDVLVEGDGATPKVTATTLMGSRVGFFKGGLTASGPLVEIGNTVTTYVNTRRIVLANTQNQIAWLTSDTAPSASIAFDNGRPGNFDGSWRILRNGSYIGGINTSGSWVWGGTEAAPNATLPTTGLPTFQGLPQDGPGLKHVRLASCTTGVNQFDTCSTTWTFTTAFPDINYTANCTIKASAGVPVVLSVFNRLAGSFQIQIGAWTAAAASGDLHCVAIHD